MSEAKQEGVRMKKFLVAAVMAALVGAIQF
jgi:hypothetical protein